MLVSVEDTLSSSYERAVGNVAKKVATSVPGVLDALVLVESTRVLTNVRGLENVARKVEAAEGCGSGALRRHWVA